MATAPKTKNKIPVINDWKDIPSFFVGGVLTKGGGAELLLGSIADIDTLLRRTLAGEGATTDDITLSMDIYQWIFISGYLSVDIYQWIR